MWDLGPGVPRKGPKNFLKNYFMKKYVRIYVRGCRREDWYSRPRDDDDGLRHLDAREGVGVA